MDYRVHPAHGVAKRRGVGEVTERDLHAYPLGPQPPWIAHQAAHGFSLGEQTAQQSGAHLPRGAGQQQHRRKPSGTGPGLCFGS
jgi:hypothetical protein